MTNEEKQEIINAVLSAIRTNSKTISQLTAVSQMSDDDYIELSGGRKVSFAVFTATLATNTALTTAGEYLDQHKVGIGEDSMSDWTHARVVYLDGMGTLDGGGTLGDGIYYKPDDKKIYDFSGNQTLPQYPKSGAVYISKVSQVPYVWNGTDLVELGEYAKNRQVIDYTVSPPAFEDMAIGTLYYVSSSKKLAVKVSESKATAFSPSPNMIYYSRDAQKLIIWNASNNTWQQIS